MSSVQEWLFALKTMRGAVGFPLVVAGLGLMLFGWRFWKICVVLSFAAIVTLVSAHLIGPRHDQWKYALVCGAALGLLSYWPANHAVAVLGGAVGGASVAAALQNLGLSGVSLYCAGAAAFALCTAYAYINRMHVAVVLTAFLGAVLLLSGLAAWLMASPSHYSTIETMLRGSALLLPFVVLVPTVMSSFYQFAEVKRVDAEL